MSKTYPSKDEQDQYESFVRAATGKRKAPPPKGKKDKPSREKGQQFNDRMNGKNC